MLDINVMHAMFALLRTVFNDGEALCESDAEIVRNNIEQIYCVSERSDMAHLVGYALERANLISPDNEYFAKFQKQQYLAMVRSEGMEYELDRLRQLFERNKIKFIPLKGAIIRSMYPEGWMRTSSDIDVLVHSEDIPFAEECIIKSLGYKKGKESEHDHSLYSPGGVHVELHFDLMEDETANLSKDILSEVWNYATRINEEGYEHRLLDEMFYFYHIAHLAKHVEMAGSGMRPFLDLWLINDKYREMDNERKGKLLEQASLKSFAHFCEEISGHWFGDEKEISDTAKKLELFVLNSGTYGTMENRILITHDTYNGTRGYILKRIFLPYRALAMVYPILQKHKWLTPFLQVARWFKLLSWKMMKKVAFEVKLMNSASQENINNMQSFMSEIGL